MQLTHRNIWLNAITFGWHAGVSDRDTYLHTLPMFHCNGWGMPYALTAMGVPQVVLRKVDGEDILSPHRGATVSRCCAARRRSWPMTLDAAAKRRDAGRDGARERIAACAWSWPARRRPPRPSSGSTPSSVGSSSRSTG